MTIIQSIGERILPRYARKRLAQKAQRLVPEQAQMQEAVRNYVKVKALNYKQGCVCPSSFDKYKALNITLDDLHHCSANDIIKFCKSDFNAKQ